MTGLAVTVSEPPLLAAAITSKAIALEVPTEKRVDIYSLAIFALLRIMVYRVDIHAIEPKSGVWDPSRIGP